jgi:DNA-binding transcriptional LysR family regulator
MKNLTLRGLRIFEVAATCESFSRAAEVLDLSQPAVSMQMKQFEEEVGVRLFEKQSRHVVLTDAGRALLVHARDILARVRLAEDAMASLQGVFSGQLHLGVISPANYFAPLLMQAFRLQYPEVRLKLSVGKRDELLAALEEGRLDVVIAGFPPAHAAIEAETFARHPHCVVAPAGHRLAERREIEWDELRDEPFVYREPGSATRQFLEHLLQSQRLQVNVSTELQGNDTVKQAVMAGMGISFLSAHTFQIELVGGQLVVLDLKDMPKMLDWCLLHRRDTPLRGVNKLFRDFLLDSGAAIVECRYK